MSIGAIVSISKVKNLAACDEAPAVRFGAFVAEDSADSDSSSGVAGAIRTRFSMRKPKQFGFESVATIDGTVQYKC